MFSRKVHFVMNISHIWMRISVKRVLISLSSHAPQPPAIPFCQRAGIAAGSQVNVPYEFLC